MSVSSCDNSAKCCRNSFSLVQSVYTTLLKHIVLQFLTHHPIHTAALVNISCCKCAKSPYAIRIRLHECVAEVNAILDQQFVALLIVYERDPFHKPTTCSLLSHNFVESCALL